MMNSILMRYLGFILVALLAGAGGGMLVASKKQANPPSGTTVAVPAQPFPGQGIPAIPAIPAQPIKPEVGKPTISYIAGAAGRNMIVNHNDGMNIFGADFSRTNNDVYWDGVLLVRNIGATPSYSLSPLPQETQQISIGVPTNKDLTLGSYHSVYVKNPHGTSNTVQVRVVENILYIPGVQRFFPNKGPVGTKGNIVTTQLVTDGQPISTKAYLNFLIPASAVKSGATGMTYVFFPIEKSSSSATTIDPLYQYNGYINGYWYGYDLYSFTIPENAIYCPSWLWDSQYCTLAPQNSTVKIPVGGPYDTEMNFVYTFQYRGTRVEGASVPYPFTVTP